MQLALNRGLPEQMTRVAAALSMALMIWPAAARSEGAIQPMGEGVIRVCRNWDMFGTSCRKYHHIKLPASISLGDAFRVTYGSNPKSFQFRVQRIKVEDGICSIYGGEIGSVRDRIRVSCQNAAQ